MSTAEILHVVALVSAWSRRDVEAATILIEDSTSDLVPNLIEFCLLVLNANTEGNPEAYLEWLGDQARTIQAHDARR